VDTLARYQPAPLAAPRPRVTPAHLVPPGGVVLSLSGTERDDLTDTVVVYGVALVAVGLVTGYLLWGR
jgi:hypothetical protein